MPPGWDAVPRLSPGAMAAASAGRGRGQSPVAGAWLGGAQGGRPLGFFKTETHGCHGGGGHSPGAWRPVSARRPRVASRQLRPLASHCCGENPPRTRRLKRGEFLLLRIWTPQVREASQGTESPRG